VKDRPALAVAIEVPTHEKLGVAFAKQNEALCEAVNGVLATLRDNGEFARLQARWFPHPVTRRVERKTHARVQGEGK